MPARSRGELFPDPITTREVRDTIFKNILRSPSLLTTSLWVVLSLINQHWNGYQR
jgi:hypothetical protein